MAVQIRLSDARHTELLEAMKEAGIHMLAIGYESPIDEDLLAMKKGYASKDMLHWTNIFRRYGFVIHGMFIFGYPGKKGDAGRISVEERIKRYRSFIKKARLDTLQVLLTIPLPGTQLRERLEKEKRIYPLKEIGWEYYDGQFPLYEPEEGLSAEEMLDAICRLMGKFYQFRNFWYLVANIVFHFPRVVFPSTFSLFTLRRRFLHRAFRKWYMNYFRKYALRFGGYFIVKNWKKNYAADSFSRKLIMAKNNLHQQELH